MSKGNDAAFTRALMAAANSKDGLQPHLEWIDGKFQQKYPNPSPMLQVEASIMHTAHKKLGLKLHGDRKSFNNRVVIEGLADTGCQTCIAGEEFLKEIGCPPDYMIPTKHRIVGITSAGLGIVGAILMRLVLYGRISRQVVYISTKVKGFYMSEGALKDLGVIDDKFPNCKPGCVTASCLSTEKESCQCPPRGSTPDRPSKLPMPATSENCDNLRQWLIDAFASTGFNQCAHQQIPKLTGKPMDIEMKPNVTPVAVHTPIPVPHHWKKQVKADLDRDVRLGIIEPVPQGTCTTWCSRMVVALKGDGSPRRTVDLQQLNRATLRETHHTPTPFNIVSTIPPNQWKTVLDAWNGYHSLPVENNARDKTTFVTEWGRYRYCRAPMGYHASGDAYTRRVDDITVDQIRVKRCVDDSILWDNDIEASFWHTFDYLKVCSDNGAVFNEKKFKFAQEEVEFAGFEVTMDGYRPTRKLLDAIEQFPIPKSVTDIRSWFGLVNQVAYTFSRTKVMTPFRDLLSTKNKSFYWDDALDEAFRASKQEILGLVNEGVCAFEINRATCLLTDWAKSGLGFALMQKHCECTGKKLTPECGPGHWKLVFAGSRFTTPTEQRYAPIEGEALALVHGLESCRMFILGCPQLTLAVDHKPLLKYFNDRELETIANPRMFALKEKSLMYQFDIEYIPGDRNCGADALSRHPVKGVACMALTDDIERTAHVAAVSEVDFRSVSWERLRDCARQSVFPSKRCDVPESIRGYWQMRDELFVIDDVPFLDHKMLIPKSLRKEVLECLHAAHQGIVGMSSHARQRFFWPGINAAIKQVRAQCKVCNENAPSQPKESTIICSAPEYPFQQVVTDLCQTSGHDFLIFADRYSGWIEVAKLNTKSFKDISKCMLRWFTTFGVPEEIASDGGPPYNSSSYDTFLKTWDIRKRQSSAYYPQSNGRAEVAVKSAKRILLGNIDPATGALDTDEVSRGFLAYRNTPLQDIPQSPAKMLYGRPMRDHLPNQHRKLRTEWYQIMDARELALAKKHLSHPPEEHQHVLPPLAPGQAVQVQNQCGNRPGKWHNTGLVVESLPHRQYKVLMDGSRRVTLRNRRFLRSIDPVARRLSDYAEMPRHIDQVTDLASPEMLLSIPRKTVTLPEPTVEPIAPVMPVELPKTPEVQFPVPVESTINPQGESSQQFEGVAGGEKVATKLASRRSERQRRTTDVLNIKDFRVKSYADLARGDRREHVQS